MSGFSFDTNIVIDALAGFAPARDEILRASLDGARARISRIVWIEVLSKGSQSSIRNAQAFLGGFAIDEVDAAIASRAASLRREQRRFKIADAIILASALVHGRTLVTRNTKDFPASMPGIRVPYIL